jgi:DNA (cytosine-5)-methyltransferase 1
MRLLDLFCGAGGAAMGYHRAGFEVVGVDINPQPHYPFEFHQADALTYPLDGFDAIHASPPCQAYSRMRHLPWVKARTDDHWDSIPPTRALLDTATVPWVIENVVGAPLDGSHPKHTKAMLPGPMLGNRAQLMSGIGKRDKLDYIIAGKGRTAGTPGLWGGAMEIDWMTIKEMAQAIPPAYTEWIGQQLMAALRVAA